MYLATEATASHVPADLWLRQLGPKGLDSLPDPVYDDVWPILDLRTGKDYIVRAATLQAARYWLADRINVPVGELV